MVGGGTSGLCPRPLGSPELCVGLRSLFCSARNSFLVFSISRTNLSPEVPKKAQEEPPPVPSDQHSFPFL